MRELSEAMACIAIGLYFILSAVGAGWIAEVILVVAGFLLLWSLFQALRAQDRAARAMRSHKPAPPSVPPPRDRGFVPADPDPEKKITGFTF